MVMQLTRYVSVGNIRFSFLLALCDLINYERKISRSIRLNYMYNLISITTLVASEIDFNEIRATPSFQKFSKLIWNIQGRYR